MLNVMDQCVGDDFAIYRGDCCEVTRGLPDQSIGYSVYSPPFSSLFVYSASDRDLGNSHSDEQFWEHYKFLIKEMRRILKPGRLISVHCMDLPTSKQMHGYIGLRDFPGEIIKAHQEVGFIYHSRVCIRKDPVTAMQRTKALGLLHKQIRKDSAMSRQGIADYIVTFRHPEDNIEPISHTAEEYPVSLWQNVAEPVWLDINPSETLQYRSAREHNDERHIAPLQLEVIRRCLNLWSNPGDVVLSPFAGIGSEGYCALQSGRKFLGIELKESYYRQACRNLANAKSDQGLLFEDSICQIP
jgi:DNA modification methylase